MTPLEQKRLAVGLTRLELADKIGITVTMIYRYEKNRAKPSAETKRKFTEFFRCGSEELWGNTAETNPVIFIPVVDRVIQASAGQGNSYIGSPWTIIDKVPFSAKSLMGYSWQGADYKIITAQGDSMEPFIHDGDDVLFAENLEVRNGDVAIVSIDGTVFVKGILYGKNSITLVSYNKEYPDRTFDCDDHEVEIKGKVLRILPKAITIPSII